MPPVPTPIAVVAHQLYVNHAGPIWRYQQLLLFQPGTWRTCREWWKNPTESSTEHRPCPKEVHPTNTTRCRLLGYRRENQQRSENQKGSPVFGSPWEGRRRYAIAAAKQHRSAGCTTHRTSSASYSLSAPSAPLALLFCDGTTISAKSSTRLPGKSYGNQWFTPSIQGK